MIQGGASNVNFRRHHMSRLLYRMGALLPLLLNGPDLARECCELEMLCWRELGHLQQPNFDWCLPPFLRLDADGHSVELSSPIDPKVVADRMAALEPLPLAAASPVGVNLNRLSCLLNLTSFESQWLVWSYCVKRFGHAILPVIAISDDRQGGEVLALLTDMPIGAVRDAVASRRLHVWCLLATKRRPPGSAGEAVEV